MKKTNTHPKFLLHPCMKSLMWVSRSLLRWARKVNTSSEQTDVMCRLQVDLLGMRDFDILYNRHLSQLACQGSCGPGLP